MIVILVVCFVLLWTSCESGLRIIGGRDALQDEFPYVVELELKIKNSLEDTIFNYIQICTGAALTPNWVLSAAHCIDDTDNFTIYNKMFLRYNSYFPNNVGLLAQFLETIVHPGYNKVVHKFDILLIRSTDIKVSEYGKVSAVDFKSLIGHEALSLGFGRTNASAFNKPLQVIKGMLSNCPYAEAYIVHMICLTAECTAKATICGEDSGGPVVHPAGIVGVNHISYNYCYEYENANNLELLPATSVAILSPISPVQDWIRNYCK